MTKTDRTLLVRITRKKKTTGINEVVNEPLLISQSHTSGQQQKLIISFWQNPAFFY